MGAGGRAEDDGKRKRALSSVLSLPGVPCALPFFPFRRKTEEASVEEKLRSKQDKTNFCFSCTVILLKLPEATRYAIRLGGTVNYVN